jgi:hypothetical protein
MSVIPRACRKKREEKKAQYREPSQAQPLPTAGVSGKQTSVSRPGSVSMLCGVGKGKARGAYSRNIGQISVRAKISLKTWLSLWTLDCTTRRGLKYWRETELFFLSDIFPILAYWRIVLTIQWLYHSKKKYANEMTT